MEVVNSVYRFINKDNEIIYIGQAKNLKNRLNSHNHLPKECYEEIERIEYTEYDTEDDMDFAERYFISKIKPKYNTIHKGKKITVNIFEFENKEWKVWNEKIENNIQENEDCKKNESEVINNIRIKMNELIILDEKIEIYKNLKDDITDLSDSNYSKLMKYIDEMRDKEHLLEKYMKETNLYEEKLIPIFVNERKATKEEMILYNLNKIKKEILNYLEDEIQKNGFFYEYKLYLKLENIFTPFENGHKEWLNVVGIKKYKEEGGGFGWNGKALDEKTKNNFMNDVLQYVFNELNEKFELKKEIRLIKNIARCFDYSFEELYRGYPYMEMNSPFIIYRNTNENYTMIDDEECILVG